MPCLVCLSAGKKRKLMIERKLKNFMSLFKNGFEVCKLRETHSTMSLNRRIFKYINQSIVSNLEFNETK